MNVIFPSFFYCCPSTFHYVFYSVHQSSEVSTCALHHPACRAMFQGHKLPSQQTGGPTARSAQGESLHSESSQLHMRPVKIAAWMGMKGASGVVLMCMCEWVLFHLWLIMFNTWRGGRGCGGEPLSPHKSHIWTSVVGYWWQSTHMNTVHPVAHMLIYHC